MKINFYVYLSESERNEMKDLVSIGNNLTGGLLDVVSLQSIQFKIDGKDDVNWVLDRLRFLQDKNLKLSNTVETLIKKHHNFNTFIGTSRND